MQKLKFTFGFVYHKTFVCHIM